MNPIPVLCFPFAGAGASMFRRWQEYPSQTLRICPVQLPGREDRFDEPPYTNVAEAIEGLFPEVQETIGERGPVALFGHSLGAVLAYAIAHRLQQVGRAEIVQVFVSGSPGPWTQRKERASDLNDEQFLAQVQKFAGYTHPALKHPELQMISPASPLGSALMGVDAGTTVTFDAGRGDVHVKVVSVEALHL